jgi:hypothetical protein
LKEEAFQQAMLSPKTSLTHAALVGARKQSVKDAELLLSFNVASFMQNENFPTEAKYVETIASWHEASDGRGLSELQRCKANYAMLNYLLDEWMPWHKTDYNFGLADINRYNIYIYNMLA